ncbi:MAG: lipopolysaccharide transport periplasmic protein LptA [Porticoccaceae bacterium]|jgi:lipopolysaccharide export system protein LptA|nr:lipopolysaccharide transport periplasmic protein LptA [Porticoccaceae bacterium]
MTSYKAQVTQLGFALFILLLAQLSSALESDRDQLMEIESDSAEFDELAGLTTYSGNVHLIQGTIELLADEIQLRAENDQIVELIATGGPARYEQLPELGAEKLFAQSNRIRYLLDQDLIELSGDASLSQQGTTLSGGTILYDVRQHILKASSGATNQNSTERVRVVLPPLGSERP